MRADLFLSNKALVLLASAALLLSAAAPVHAQVAGPCADTVKKYCSGITPGGGRIKQCLEGHADDLPLACREWLGTMRVKADDMNRACFEEIGAFCNFDKPDQMRIAQCLEERYVNLKLNCREKLREFMNPLRNP